MIGALVGVGVTAFRLLMGAIGTVRNGLGEHPVIWYQWAYLPLIGLVGGLVAGQLAERFAPEARSGVSLVMAALARPGQHLRARSVWVTFFATAIAVGAGMSMGREGPAVQMGGGVGSWVAARTQSRQRRQLIAAGAGAGVAASFNAPLAGVLFVLESMLQDFSSLTLASAILASMTAAAIAQVAAGSAFLFDVPAPVYHASNLPWFLLLGAAAGVLGVVFLRCTWACQAWSERLAARWSRGWHPAVVGFLSGLLGLFLPQVLGGGLGVAQGSLEGGIAWHLIPLILAVRLGLTAMALGSGAPGGIFGPSLVMGSLLGLWMGKTVSFGMASLSPVVSGFAFAGMGAFAAAVTRTPVTSIVIVFEMTGNYTQILPLMAAVLSATLVAERLEPRNAYTYGLARLNVALDDVQPPLWHHDQSVGEAMTREVESLPASLPLSEVAARLRESTHHGFPVVDAAGMLVAVVTRHDLQQALSEGEAGTTEVGAIARVPVLTITPDQSLMTAWNRMARLGVRQLVVVDPAEPRRIVGILTASDMLHAMPV